MWFRACAPARRGTTTADEEDEFLEPSLDAFWKITPSLTAALTLNPDFSGTTADTRQVNLTRFDLFFPEQRAFFLQDSDIFEFGRLEEESGIPFFSRRIGLDDDGEALTLDAGLKLTGRAGPLSVGVLGVRQDAAVGPESVDLFVGRIAVNVLEESSVGAIVTSGNPDPRVDNCLVGRRLPLPQYAPGRQPQHRGDGLVPADRHRRAVRRRFGVRVQFRDAEQRWLERRDRPQGDRGELFPCARASRAARISRRPSAGSATPGARRISWIRRVESEIGAEFVEPINGSDRSHEIELQLVEVENQAADYLTLTHLFIEDEFAEPFEISEGVVIPAGTYTFDYACISLYTGEQRVLATESSGLRRRLLRRADFHLRDEDYLAAECAPQGHLRRRVQRRRPATGGFHHPPRDAELRHRVQHRVVVGELRPVR